jgi:hypothetical protein
MNTGRLDKIVNDLERLHRDAQDILNAYVNEKICNHPYASFGEAKVYCFRQVGTQMNVVNALKLVRAHLTK